MKNTVILSALLALAPISFAQETAASSAVPAQVEFRVNLKAMQILKKLLALLQSITDKESADKAAPQILAFQEEIKASVEAEPQADEAAADSMETELEQFSQAMYLLTEMDKAIARLRKADFYGSESLMEIFGAEEEEARATPAAPADVEAFITECVKESEKLAIILEGVKDKESADKAAAEIAPIRASMEAMNAVIDGLSEEDMTKLMVLLMSSFHKAGEIMFKLEEVDFYGSKALESIMKD